MDKPALYLIKVGGNILDDETLLPQFIQQLAALHHPYVLVHGGGKKATTISAQLGIETRMIEGRRITDAATRDVVVMVYAGLINKQLVALLQQQGQNAIGLCGVDANLIPAQQRSHGTIPFGWVGDALTDEINTPFLCALLKQQLVPVIAPITHNKNGALLNTNADAIASSLAIALGTHFTVNLVYCFEKNGVLNNNRVMPALTQTQFNTLKNSGTIQGGMIPKLTQAFDALNNGVEQVYITHALHVTQLNTHTYEGTTLVKH